MKWKVKRKFENQDGFKQYFGNESQRLKCLGLFFETYKNELTIAYQRETFRADYLNEI